MQTVESARGASRAPIVGRIPVVALGLSLSLFLALSFTLCVLAGLILPDWNLHKPWLQFFPGFIAIGAGTDVAIESADVVLVRSDPRDVFAILALSRATYAKMVQNLLWATGYNAVAIPLAAGIGYAWGVVLTPALGAALMSLSTVIVAINAKLLERARALVSRGEAS